MRVRPNLALFTFAAAATMLGACERRDAPAGGNANDPKPINPVAKGIDAPPEPAAAPAN